jgi:hypothetical protein
MVVEQEKDLPKCPTCNDEIDSFVKIRGLALPQ